MLTPIEQNFWKKRSVDQAHHSLMCPYYDDPSAPCTCWVCNPCLPPVDASNDRGFHMLGWALICIMVFGVSMMLFLINEDEEMREAKQVVIENHDQWGGVYPINYSKGE